MKKIISWKNYSENDLESIALELNSKIKSPSCLFLEGKMGVGKTTFTRVFAKSLFNYNLSSPTYSILTEEEHILHGDFYRLKSEEELLHLEIGIYLEGKQYLFFEWGMQYFSAIHSELPDEFYIYRLNIENSDDSKYRSATLYEINN